MLNDDQMDWQERPMTHYPEMADLALLTLHRTTLFCHDANGQLLTINEPGFPDPPRFWMGRTLEGNQWAYHHALPAATVERLDALCRAEPVASDLRRSPQNADAIKAVLSAHASLRSEYRGPAYWVPQGAEAPNQAIMITAANAELLRRHFADLLEPDAYHLLGPVAGVVEDGAVVAVAFCSRIPGQATEAGVNTHVAYRRRGYAVQAVAAWAAAVYEQSCLPLYSTGWENLASQSIARTLGMISYGEDWSIQ